MPADGVLARSFQHWSLRWIPWIFICLWFLTAWKSIFPQFEKTSWYMLMGRENEITCEWFPSTEWNLNMFLLAWPEHKWAHSNSFFTWAHNKSRVQDPEKAARSYIALLWLMYIQKARTSAPINCFTTCTWKLNYCNCPRKVAMLYILLWSCSVYCINLPLHNNFICNNKHGEEAGCLFLETTIKNNSATGV